MSFPFIPFNCILLQRNEQLAFPAPEHARRHQTQAMHSCMLSTLLARTAPRHRRRGAAESAQMASPHPLAPPIFSLPLLVWAAAQHYGEPTLPCQTCTSAASFWATNFEASSHSCSSTTPSYFSSVFNPPPVDLLLLSALTSTTPSSTLSSSFQNPFAVIPPPFPRPLLPRRLSIWRSPTRQPRSSPSLTLAMMMSTAT